MWDGLFDNAPDFNQLQSSRLPFINCPKAVDGIRHAPQTRRLTWRARTIGAMSPLSVYLSTSQKAPTCGSSEMIAGSTPHKPQRVASCT